MVNAMAEKVPMMVMTDLICGAQEEVKNEKSGLVVPAVVEVCLSCRQLLLVNLPSWTGAPAGCNYPQRVAPNFFC